MLKSFRKRMQDREDGFTLIELMVVVLIIAILIAIAIPTFLGARKRAQDRAVQSNLRNALTAEKTYYTDKQVYTASATDLTAIEPSLSYSNAVSTTDPRQIKVETAADSNSSLGQVVCLAAISKSGKGFQVKDVLSGTDAGTWYTSWQPPAAEPSCTYARTNAEW